MPRTFTLAWLMLGITLVCIYCGMVVSKDEKTVAYALTVAALTPVAIIALTLVSFSRRRKTVLAATFVGAIVGILFFGAGDNGGPAFNSPWDAVGPVFVQMAFSAAFWDFVFGGVTLAIDPPVSH